MAEEPLKKYNYSIIVNHGDTNKFGCSRRCEYCNWQRLRNFGKSLPDITNQNFDDAKGYITISGGGDPLWSGNQRSVMDYIPFLVTQIIAKGHKPRIITREVSNFKAVTEETHANIYLSLSYDEIVIKEILANHELSNFIIGLAKKQLIEMTIVAGAELDLRQIGLPIFEICKLQDTLGIKFPITIRENLRSIKYLKKDYIHKVLEHIRKNILNYEPDIRWLPAKVCLDDNIYIIAPHKCFGYHVKLYGNEITPNYVEAFNLLSNNQHYMVFGSVARYIATYQYLQNCELKIPIYMPEYHDIDVFVEEGYLNNLIEKLSALGFTRNKRISEHKIRIYHPLDTAFSIDINLVQNIDIAKVIVSEALYNINRIGILNGDLLIFKGFDYTDLLTFKARELPHRWDYLNFNRRDKSEEKMFTKLSTRGWKIYRMSIFGRILQAYYKIQAHVKRYFQKRKNKNGK